MANVDFWAGPSRMEIPLRICEIQKMNQIV